MNPAPVAVKFQTGTERHTYQDVIDFIQTRLSAVGLEIWQLQLLATGDPRTGQVKLIPYEPSALHGRILPPPEPTSTVDVDWELLQREKLGAELAFAR